jgi:hypothetical protein
MVIIKFISGLDSTLQIVQGMMGIKGYGFVKVSGQSYLL